MKKVLQEVQKPETEISAICQTEQITDSQCGISDDVVTFSFLKVEKNIEDMLNYFYIMADDSKCSIFMELWEKARKKYLDACDRDRVRPSLTLPQVVVEMWSPVYEESQQIVQNLASFAMPLNQLKRYSFPKDKDKLDESIRNLSFVVNMCRKLEGKEQFGDHWVRDTVDRILKYNVLCKYAAAADTLEKLKNSLQLTGDFSIVKTLSEQVSEVFASIHSLVDGSTI